MSKEISSRISNRIVELCTSEKLKTQITLLPQVDIIQWLHGDISFLEILNSIKGYRQKRIKKECGTYKNGNIKYKYISVDDKNRPIWLRNKREILDQRCDAEAKWQMEKLKGKRPDLFDRPGHKQKSLFGVFGEEIVKEYFILTDKLENDKPVKLNGHQLDLETNDSMIEVKTGSYCTTGTANEKIYGVPFKYADVPRLYNKPLQIICLGAAVEEDTCGISTCPEKEKLKTYWADGGITYIDFTKLLSSL